MQRIAQVIRLKPEAEAEYIRCHKEVWPSVLECIGRAHIENYSIFLVDGTLFAYFEYRGSDYAADMQAMASCPEMRRWWKMIDPMQEIMPTAARSEKWLKMQEVFYFSGVAPSQDTGSFASTVAGDVESGFDP